MSPGRRSTGTPPAHTGIMPGTAGPFNTHVGAQLMPLMWPTKNVGVTRNPVACATSTRFIR